MAATFPDQIGPKGGFDQDGQRPTFFRGALLGGQVDFGRDLRGDGRPVFDPGRRLDSFSG